MIQVLFFLLLAASTPSPAKCQENGETTAKSFCYDGDCGPRTWAGKCNTGIMQSPIDIPDTNENYRNSKSASLYFSNKCWGDKPFFLENKGSTVEASLTKDHTSRCYMKGDNQQNGILAKEYTFSQVHFHWGGTEHTFLNTSYAMEAHFVHYSTKYKSLEEAEKSDEAGAIAVVAVIFELSTRPNYDLTPIINLLSKVNKAGAKTEGRDLNLMNLLSPNDGKTYISRYEGSLTTPNCKEIVSWIVLTYPLNFLSKEQLEKFKGVLDGRGKALKNNVRPIQSANSRDIRFFRATIY